MARGGAPMQGLKLLLDEIRYRKLNFALCVLAVAATCVLFVAGPMLVEGYAGQTIAELKADEDATRKIMLQLGFNLLIVHQDTEMSDFYSRDFAAVDMPQAYVDKLAQSSDLINVRHLVPYLKAKVAWRDRSVLLVGELPEVTQIHFGKKKPLGFVVTPGTVQVGYELRGTLAEGEEVELLGRKLRVAKLLPQRGTKDDITLAVHLEDAQAMLGKPDTINEILALGCECAADQVGLIREQLRGVLPDTKITSMQDRFVTRAEQRQVQAERLATARRQWDAALLYSTPALVAVCGLFVGLFTLANVRERRTEIGLLRALGKESWRIGALFLGKAALVGLAGGALGAVLGVAAARAAGERFLEIGAEYLPVDYLLVSAALAGAPLVCGLAAYLPTLAAVRQDPAVVLRDV